MSSEVAMNKLDAELQRLYGLPGQLWPSAGSEAECPRIELLSPAGQVRCLVLSIANTCGWEPVAALYQGVQEDLGWPAPAISVSVEDGYLVWFSLAEAIPLDAALDLMHGLGQKYLAATKALRPGFRPGPPGEANFVPSVPARQQDSERWSAFIDPTMGSMFVEESWLEMPPSLDRQAAMLVGLESIKAEDVRRASSLLRGGGEMAAASHAGLEATPPAGYSAALPPVASPATLNLGSGFADPKSFLLAVMNDPSASAEHRMAAAIALLPFCDKAAET